MVINAAASVHDEKRVEGQFSFYKNGFKSINKRYFSVQSVQESEVLTLTAQDIDYMKRDFPISSNYFFKRMMQQTKNLLVEHLDSLTNMRSPKYTLAHYASFAKISQKVNKTLGEENIRKVYNMMKDK